MGCGSCSTGGCAPAGCKSNGSCLTNGCSKLDVYDWLSHMDMPSNFKAFNIIEVKFKGSRKEFFLNTENLYLEAGELVAVETTTGGFDVGHVSLTGELVRMQLKKRHVRTDDVVKKIYRKASLTDVEKWKISKDLEFETMHKARVLAKELGLAMKLSDVDYQGDRTKATFYYTAEGRVDFRELIKKMAETFRIRIEMRQIGMRQEASRLGGIGSCGRELCCSTWLTDFKTVSTSAARYQNLSLNTLKLAGQCGKLKCCLNYELDTYMDALRDIPDNVERLETLTGTVRHQKTDIFKKLMWFSYPNDDNWIPLDISRVKEIQKLNKEGIKPEYLKIEIAEEDKPVVQKTFDYENVVGQDSLTRLDNKGGKNKRNNRNKNRNKLRGQGDPNVGSGTQATQETAPKPQNPNQQQRPAGQQAERPAGPNRNNKRRKNFRNNNNRERPSGDNPAGGKPTE
jgi:cell fate regulator YaaT (PSP1 superfamily)